MKTVLRGKRIAKTTQWEKESILTNDSVLTGGLQAEK
jgi:hypothetical protein